MKEFFYLDNGTIRAKILFPVNKKYEGKRFCHSGFITDIWYKNVKFSEYERSQGDPTTEGSGMCAAYEPLEMEKPADGQRYLMPGVGVLTAGDTGREFERLPTEFSYDDLHAVFTTQSPDVDGYSYFETRKIMLEDDEIKETVTLRNTGSKRFACSEYNHNFLSLGGLDIGTDYEMRVYCIQKPESFSFKEKVMENGIFTYDDYPTRSCFFKTFDTKPVREDGMAWEMRSKSTGISCYEKVDFVPDRLQVWNDYYVMCCEVFAPVDLAPGEEVTWTRRWGFSV